MVLKWTCVMGSKNSGDMKYKCGAKAKEKRESQPSAPNGKWVMTLGTCFLLPGCRLAVLYSLVCPGNISPRILRFLFASIASGNMVKARSEVTSPNIACTSAHLISPKNFNDKRGLNSPRGVMLDEGFNNGGELPLLRAREAWRGFE